MISFSDNPQWRTAQGCLAALAMLYLLSGYSAAQSLSAKCASAAPSSAQAQTPARPVTLRETVMVLGEPDPVVLGEAARSGERLDVKGQQDLAPQFTDILRADNSVDLQQRGNGVQSDVSIRGASFEQTLVLVNGLRVNDAQTSHFNLDVPLPLDAIAGMDVLHGAGSTLYGSDAIGGVLNLRTAPFTETSLRLRSGVGSYGINTQAAEVAAAGRKLNAVVAGSRDFSSGFIADRDYRSEQGSAEGWLTTALGVSDVLLAGSDRGYGAAGYYGNYPSFERTKGWFASLQQSLGENMGAALAYRRHTDRFVLLRTNPGYYTNQHIDESWQARLRRTDHMGSHFALSSGLEENLDSILSNNLGRHARNRGAGYLEVAWSGSRGRLEAGLREEVLSGGRVITSPSLSGSLPLKNALKLRGALGYGFRLPTFTDLYYSDPTQTGNAALLPESAWSYEGGADWFARPDFVLSATGFTSPQHNAIDYTRASSADKWHATNLSGFRYSGVEVSAKWQLTNGSSLRAGWTFLSGDASVLSGLQSKYVFRFPAHNATLDWLGNMGYGFRSRAHMHVTQRTGQSPYAIVDAGFSRAFGEHFETYAQISNLANTGYEEILGVRMQGRAFTGGVSIRLARKR